MLGLGYRRLIRPLLIVISLALTGRLIWQFFSS